MKRYMIAVALAAITMFTAVSVDARSSYSSSSRSYSSRSYSSPSRSYSSPSSYKYTKPGATRYTPSKVPRATTINRTTVIVKQKIVYRPSRVTSNYSQMPYYQPQPRPSFFQNNAGWLAFGALGAYMLLSDDEKAAQPGPDTEPLKQVSMQEISKGLWQDGSFDANDLAVYKEWQRVNGK